MSSAVSQIILAPMEGVLDALMREILTSINPFDLCITEFIRVVDQLLPERVFHRMSPELLNGGKTKSNTPIRLQLLGQDPNWMAENAVRAIELGSNGIDLNFGCPAKTVNKNKGGAVLLKTPETIYKIVSNVKNSLERNEVVSVKIRLGFDDTSLLNEIVDAIVQANANLLTIHARTKAQGYRAPAYWHHIGEISERFPIEIIANGEIWNADDAHNCIKQAKTNKLMLGRGVLAMPNLGCVVKHNAPQLTWEQMRNVFLHYCELELAGSKSFYFSSRLKQWLRYLKIHYPQAELLFDQIKTLKDKNAITEKFEMLSVLEH